jgi:hypothetical protein
MSMVQGDLWCIAERWLQLGCSVFAALAAVTWWLASRAKVPHPITWENINAFSAGAVKQSRLNAWAALFAAVAALLQIPLAFMPTCWG